MATTFLNPIPVTLSSMPSLQRHELRALKIKRARIVNYCRGNWKNQHLQNSGKSRTPYAVGSTTTAETGPDACCLHNGETGIGIVHFFQGKTLLVTGATGFLAKVLVEKIMHSLPSIGKVYLLIRARNDEAAMERLKIMLDDEIFKCLKQKYGKSFEPLMMRKLVPVAGDISETGLGLKDHTIDALAREVDVIVNSAANTTFDDCYDVSIGTNTQGAIHLMDFAKDCQQLKLFLHVSTAYVSGKRQDIIKEQHFCMGRKDVESKEAWVGPPTLDVLGEIQLASDSKEAAQDPASVVQHMKKLGLTRAKANGWHDTYTFTKSMGEMMMNEKRGEVGVPVVIIRPSIIESTYRDPFPGWIEGNRMVDPIIRYYGKGLITGFVADPTCVLDIVPADMVVNAILAATAKHGMAKKKKGIFVYQVTSSTANPLIMQDLFTLLFQYFQSAPFMDAKGRPIHVQPMQFYVSMQHLNTHLQRDSTRLAQFMGSTAWDSKQPHQLQSLVKRLGSRISYLATLYEPYFLYSRRFDCSNTKGLMGSMSREEKKEFGFDVETIDWKHYIQNVHLPGLIRSQ